ncbi:MAG: zf-HC2 domain-containing protein [Bellilinea sp.]|nr:zf-HC2 domain-containing protein [Bellilinea sp.]
MNCEELIRYLSDYIDNNLDEDLRADAEEHLRTCHNCHVVLDTTRKTILMYKGSLKEPIPAPRREALFDRLLKAIEEHDDCPPEGIE